MDLVLKSCCAALLCFVREQLLYGRKQNMVCSEIIVMLVRFDHGLVAMACGES